MARYEWIILEIAVLGLLIAELISIRRTIARDRKTPLPANPPDPNRRPDT